MSTILPDPSALLLKGLSGRTDYSGREGLVRAKISLKHTINHNLLQVLRLSHHCHLSASSFQRVVHPSRTDAGQRVPAFRFGDSRVTALFQALILNMHRPSGSMHKDLRPYVAELLGPDCSYTTHKITYDLCRLRHKGIIYRIPKTNRYSVST
jgi:hypothetical protein